MEVVVRATVVFVLLLVMTRALRRRTLAEMAPFEMLLLITIGDIVQQGVTQEDYSLTGSVLAAGTMGLWVSVISFVTWRWRRVGRILDGTPLVLIRDGVIDEAALRVELIPTDELAEAARQNGIIDMSQVHLAVLEPSGRISFIEKRDED